jgi:putative ABC transport system substrate-binding protein
MAPTAIAGPARRASGVRRTRRRFLRGGLALTSLGLLLGCGLSPVPPPRPPRGRLLGVLTLGSPEPAAPYEAFRQALHELGYAEGRDLALEWRFADGASERLPGLADELVRLAVDVIFAVSTPASLAAKAATATIPIVMTRVGDPVRSGLVASLAHPGGNVTGLSTLARELSRKRLQLLKEALPALSRVAVLWNAANPGIGLAVSETEAAGPQLGTHLHLLGVQRLDEVDGALEAAARQGAGALLVLEDQWLAAHQALIVDSTAKRRLPVMSQFRAFTEAGGLLAYGPSDDELFRRPAVYVDKILKGAKPADLPVEQPTMFDLALNLQTARTLGLTIPPSVLQQATELIQ